MQIFVVSDSNEVALRIQEVLRGAGYECPDSQIVPTFQGTKVVPMADVMVVGLSPNPDAALDVLRQMSQAAKASGEPKCLLAVGPADANLILRAIQEATQYIDETNISPTLETELKKIIVRPRHNGSVVAVVSPSGGSGSSVIASNLATVLAREYRSCGLIDMKLGAGVLDALLNLKPSHNFAEVCRNLDTIDPAQLERMMVKHPSGVYLLPAPTSFQDVEAVTPEAVHAILSVLRGLFPYIVVDADRTFGPEQIEVYNEADVILMVVRLDFTSLRNAKQMLDHLENMQITRKKVQVVFNRQGQPQEVKPKQAEDALGIRAIQAIPDDARTVNRAINIGVPVVLDSPKATVSRSIIDMVKSLNGQPPEHAAAK